MLERTLTLPSLPETIRNGFRTCGLYPFNPDAVDYSKCVQNTIESLNNSPDTSDNQPHSQDVLSAEKVIKIIAPTLKASGIDVHGILQEILRISSSGSSPEECSSEEIVTDPPVAEVDFPVIETANSELLVNIEDIINGEIMFHLPDDFAQSVEASASVTLPQLMPSES